MTLIVIENEVKLWVMMVVVRIVVMAVVVAIVVVEMKSKGQDRVRDEVESPCGAVLGLDDGQLVSLNAEGDGLLI